VYWKKKLQILLVKTVVFVKGVLDERKYENLSFKKAQTVKGALERKSFRSFWPDSPFPSSG